MSDPSSYPNLKITTLGGLAFQIGDQPVAGLTSRKAQALLLYLSHTGRPHAREVLAELLWFERAPERALGNLRHVLHALRRPLEPYLAINREAIAIRPERVWLDAHELVAALAPLSQPGTPLTPQLAAQAAEALDRYQGDFLLGFPAGDSRGFEDWLSLERERLHRQVLEGLADLAAWHLGHGEYPAGTVLTRRLLELDPLLESAHRQLMRLLALSDQRQAALAHYQTCRQVLADELGVEPEAETTALFEQIRAGELQPPEMAAPAPPIDIEPYYPAFLDHESDPFEPPAFVAREAEMARLEAALEAVLAGQGRPLFVAGEAGAGKTALLEAFARRAQEQHPELLVALGHCNVQSGIGDPYLPFRQALATLTGDVEAHWSARRLSGEQALRLWRALPETARTLLDHGPDLLDSFLPAGPFLARLAGAAPQAGQLIRRLEGRLSRPDSLASDLEPARYFEQFAAALQHLAERHPLLLILDDLQWVDGASTNLLFHLGRSLAGNRILLLGAYRPDEVALGRHSAASGERERHPLEKTLPELQRTFGQVRLDLDRQAEAQGQAFVEAFLDTQPNRLDAAFRRTLAAHTGGHPLFTVELLQALQDRGALLQDRKGNWVARSNLDWGALPARVEGVIEERINRLEDELRDILTVASVEGENFTAQVVARVQEADERGLVRRLSRELDKKHRLVGEHGTQQVGKWRLSLYRFRHSLFRQHLYNGLGEVERQLLHRDVGNVLERLYDQRSREIAPQLAWHFRQADDSARAVQYALTAGDHARLLHAHREAASYYEQALELIRERGEIQRAAHTLMKLGLTYHIGFQFEKSREAYDEGFLLWQQMMEEEPGLSAPPAPHPLRLTWAEPATLDPNLAPDFISSALIEQLFFGLVEQTPDLDIVPAAAQSWEVMEDGTKYVFYLKRDIEWQDSQPLTAHDFEYSWKRLLNPALGAPLAHLLFDLRGAREFNQGRSADPQSLGVRAVDDFTLEIELETANSHFPHLLSHSVAFPVPQHRVEAEGPSWVEAGRIVSNGPFRLVDWRPGELIRLTRNPGYGGRISGNVRDIEVSLSTHSGELLERYRADELDVLGNFALRRLSGRARESARHLYAEDYVSGPEMATNYVVLDVRRPPLDDPRVRQALVMAIDRKTMANVLLKGDDLPATTGYSPPGLPGHGIKAGLPYDPVGARRLLADAGYPEGSNFVVDEALAPPFFAPYCEFLRSEWKKNLGIVLEWTVMEWTTFIARLKERPANMFISGSLAAIPDPDFFLRLDWIWDVCGWHHETFRRMIDQAKQTLKQSERIQLYEAATRILIEEAPIIPLTYLRWHLLKKRWVRKLPISAMKWWYLKDVILEPHD